MIGQLQFSPRVIETHHGNIREDEFADEQVDDVQTAEV